MASLVQAINNIISNPQRDLQTGLPVDSKKRLFDNFDRVLQEMIKRQQQGVEVGSSFTHEAELINFILHGTDTSPRSLDEALENEIGDPTKQAELKGLIEEWFTSHAIEIDQLRTSLRGDKELIPEQHPLFDGGKRRF